MAHLPTRGRASRQHRMPPVKMTVTRRDKWDRCREMAQQTATPWGRVKASYSSA